MQKILMKIPLNDEKSNQFYIRVDGESKFKNDIVYINNGDLIIIVDGVIFNKSDLINNSTYKEWEEIIKIIYLEKGDKITSVFEGSYNVFIYDKKNKSALIYSDNIGAKPIYYSIITNYLIVSNNYVDLVRELKKNNFKIKIDIESAYILLTYGYLFESKTILEGINRLLIGNFLKVEYNQIKEKQFYILSNDSINISEKEAIEEIDKRFVNAIHKIFSKDLEYGYKHLVSLSGGLDSRMTSWVANQLGYSNQLNVTFSQSNYLDQTIAQQIAADLNHEWLFKALDNGTFLKDIDLITPISGGNVTYSGLAHGYSLYKYMNFANLGILHTGQLGDVILGTYSSKPIHNEKYSLFSGAFSKKLSNKVNYKSDINYKNEELFKFYIRGLYGINQGLLPIQTFTESYSPFYDIDFLNFALSLPLTYRYNHYIYKKWILNKYPRASQYIWESSKSKITANTIRIKNKEYTYRKIIKIISDNCIFKKSPDNTKYHMNPLSYWINNNVSLKNELDSYFMCNIKLLDRENELQNDCSVLYESGSGSEKNQVISLLSAIKFYRELK